jgi:DNA-binding transcriptional ArsR family regulator
MLTNMRIFANTETVKTVDLLLHPVRLRIVQSFLGGRELTTAQLAAELADVPARGLYRHMTLLTAAGVLTVLSERQVRGTVERTYALRLEATGIAGADLAEMSPEEHLQAFAAFVAGLLADYERYLSGDEPNLERDGVGYSVNAVWLTDEEFSEFTRDVVAIVQPRMALPPGPGRTRRLIASVFMPLLPESTPERRRS